MDEHTHLSRDEFYAGLNGIAKAMDSGFGQINARLDRLNGKTEKQGNDITRLDTLIGERERVAAKDPTARAGGFLGAAAAAAALIWQWVKS